MKYVPLTIRSDQVFCLNPIGYFEHAFCRHGRFECKKSCPHLMKKKKNHNILVCGKTGEILGELIP